MQITISKQIIKREDSFIESFSVLPNNRITQDEQRDLRILIRFLIERLSVSPEFELLEANWFNGTFIKKFKIQSNERVPVLSLSFTFKYLPVNGKRKCRTCNNLYKKNICLYKNKKINKDYYYNCWGYLEKGGFRLDMEALKGIQLFQ